ncbi:CBS domain-containing protein [Sphingobium sp. PNB]|uniref:CBS domain-containing protein n=1 Tax=Sphingobium sp. PNB TaxID=863934 RepID=UPI001CA452B5|nr:CBS domain-containing protein [Sphingobium sp. PNB]MCB4858762.1 CBS domain-containing protein [Sphingobium sp. PNB]
MKASDVMSLGAATITHDASLAQAIRTMANHHISALPVVDRGGHLQGIISEGDFFRREERPARLTALFGADANARINALESRTVGEIMSRDPITIGSDASMEEAIELMECHAVKRLPVVTDGRVVGLISRADVLHALVA